MNPYLLKTYLIEIIPNFILNDVPVSKSRKIRQKQTLGYLFATLAGVLYILVLVAPSKFANFVSLTFLIICSVGTLVLGYHSKKIVPDSKNAEMLILLGWIYIFFAIFTFFLILYLNR